MSQRAHDLIEAAVEGVLFKGDGFEIHRFSPTGDTFSVVNTITGRKQDTFAKEWSYLGNNFLVLGKYIGLVAKMKPYASQLAALEKKIAKSVGWVDYGG